MKHLLTYLTVVLAFLGFGTVNAAAQATTMTLTLEGAIEGITTFQLYNNAENGSGYVNVTPEAKVYNLVSTVDDDGEGDAIGFKIVIDNANYEFETATQTTPAGVTSNMASYNAAQRMTSQYSSGYSYYIKIKEKEVVAPFSFSLYIEDISILRMMALRDTDSGSSTIYNPTSSINTYNLATGDNSLTVAGNINCLRVWKATSFSGTPYITVNGTPVTYSSWGDCTLSEGAEVRILKEAPAVEQNPVVNFTFSNPNVADCITFTCADAVIEDGKTWNEGFEAPIGSKLSLQVNVVDGTNYMTANINSMTVNGESMPVSKYLLNNYTILGNTEIVIDGFKYETYDFTINCPYPAAVDAYLQEKVTSDDSALLTAVTSPTGNTYAAGSKLPVTLMTIPSGENTYHVGDHEYWGAFVNKIMVEPLSGYYIEEISSTAGEVTKSNSTVVAYFVPVAPNCTVTLNLQPIVRDKTLKINVAGVITSNGWSVTSDGKSTDVNARKLEGVTLELADNSDPITLHTGLNTISYGRGDSPMRLIFTGAFEGVAELTDSNSGDVIAPNDQRGSVWFIDADALAEEVNEGENVELDFVSKFSATPKVNVSYSSNFLNVKPLIVKTSSVFDYYRIPLNDNRPSDEEIKENQVAYDNMVYANSQCLPMGVESINLNSNAGEYLIIHKIYGMDLTSVMFNNEEMVNSFITDEVSILLFPWQADNNLEIMGDDNLVATGIDAVLNGENATADVYNLQGVCVRRAADKQNINDLPKGLYIIDGRKVIVK